MGLCLSRENKPTTKRRSSKRITNSASNGGGGLGSNRWGRNRSSRKSDENLIHERALAAAILFQQQMQQRNGAFDRSTSLRYPTNGNSKRSYQPLPRSSSTRSRSVTDPLLPPHHLLNQDIKLDDLETSHIVLVHGGGFGAWCWYKTIALLEECGYKVTAVDLTGSGVNSSDTNSITGLSQYVKPLTDFLQKLPDGEKVILVGHDFGGACISQAMELFPSKVAKAIFIAAAMLTSGQSALDMFSEKVESNDLMRKAQVFIYANGNNQPPTAIDFDKSLVRDLLFNQSPTKDVALASVSMRPIPFLPVLEKLSLSETNHGSVRRFYIETMEDHAIPFDVQENMINRCPPEQVFRLKDVLLVRSINEYPHPIAYKTYEVGLRMVKDLTLARRFIMQKLAVTMLTTLDQLKREALVETARDVSIMKEFAMEVSRSKDYSDLGRMLLKLQKMILVSCIASGWLQQSSQSWRQRCQDAKSAECIEMLKEELDASILWGAVNSLSAQLEPRSEWRNWKHEVMKWFSAWHPMNPVVGDQPNNCSQLTPTNETSRKRAKLEIRRANVTHASSSNHSDPSQNSLTVFTGYDANITPLDVQTTPTRVESAVPNDLPICGGTTILGTKCKHRALTGSSFCKKHRPQDGKMVTSLLGIVKGHGPEIDETVQCVGGDERCLEIPKRHSLYCEKHIPRWLKRARSGKSRILSKEVFIELLKDCDSKEKKLQLHQACELFYQLFKNTLSMRSPVPKDEQFQWAISEASKDLRVGELLMKLVSHEKDRLKKLWGFGDNQILQDSTFEEAGALQVQIASNNAKESAFSGSGSVASANSSANAKQIKNNQKYICRFCGLKFDLLPDLGRHHQAAHMGQTPTGPSSTKKGIQFYAQKLKSGRLTGPKFRKGLNSASYKIRNRSIRNLKKRSQTSSSIGALETTDEPTVHDASTLGRLAYSQCSSVAKLLFSGIKKTRPYPTNSEVLAIAHSACCKVSLQAGLEGRYGSLPENMCFRAAKMCSEQNIIVEWHQDGFVCPKGCKPIVRGPVLSQMEFLSDYSFKATSSVPIMPSEWKMDESHCVLDSHHFSSDISENNITLCDDISFGLESVPITCVVDENLLNPEGNVGQLAESAFPWKSYTYVTKPVVDRVPVRLESSQLGCDCGYSTCSPGTCNHVYLFDNDYEDAKDIYGNSMQGRFPYDERGRIILEEGYLVSECNQRCSCSRGCRNRVLQNGVRVKLEVFKTENKGWAVRTREAILRGTFVCEYVGEVIDKNEANERRVRYGEKGCKYFYEIDAEINDVSRLVEEQVPYVIDATNYGNVSRYINHSCSPNLVNHQVLVESMDSQLAHIGLYASRDIASGEELTHNFRYKLLPGDGCSCLCGSSNCRGRLY